MRDFCGDEQHGGSIFARGDASTTADAGRGIHRNFLVILGNGNSVSVRCAAGRNRDVTAGRDDAVERTAVDDKILDDRKGFGAPRLDRDGFAVIEMAHVKLAGRGAAMAAVGDAINYEGTHTADSFAAI